MWSFRWQLLLGALCLMALSVVKYLEHGSGSNRAIILILFGLDVLFWTSLGCYKYAWPLALYSAAALLIAMFYPDLAPPLLLALTIAASIVWFLQPPKRKTG